MGNTKTKNGTTYSVSIPPSGTNKDWQNFGNLYLDSQGTRGTFYLKLTVAQLDQLRKAVDDNGVIESKISVFRKKDQGDKPAKAAPAPAGAPA